MLDIVERLRIDEMTEDGQWEREARVILARLLNDAAEEIERLRKKCNSQSMILRRLDAEKFPGTYFIHGGLGETDANGMPEKLMVVPAYGVDFSYIYQRTEKTIGPGW